MLDTVLYDYIYTTISWTGGFVYGSAEKLTAPYIIMRKVTDQEQPAAFCDTQGLVGEALFQFSGYSGGVLPTNAIAHVQYLQAFKEQIKTIKGTIGTTEKYLISSNITTGVRLLNDGLNELNVWGAFFETTLRWKAV